MACTRDHVRHVDVAPRTANTQNPLAFHLRLCVLVVTDVYFAARDPRIWHVLCVPKRRYVLVAAKSLHQNGATSLMALP